MSKIKIAFDAATSCGVCWGVPFETPECLTWNLKAQDNGERGLILMKRATALIDRLLAEHEITHAFIEAPMRTHKSFQKHGGAETANTAILLNGYVFMLQTILFSRHIPVTLYDRQDVLRHFTGQPRYKNTDDGKRACIRIAQMLKYPASNWDEADACALWDYGCAKSNPRAYALAGVNRPALNRSAKCRTSSTSGGKSTARRRRQPTLQFT